MTETAPGSWPLRARNAWLAGVVLGYLVAAIAALNPPGSLLLGAFAAVAPTMALLAYPRRPGLLLPAGAIAIASLYLTSIYGLPMVVIGWVWLWVHRQVSGSKPSGAAWALIVGVGLWLATPGVMTIHEDPSCEQTLRDGTVQSVDPATRGYPTGWVWQADSNFSSDEVGGFGDVVADSCVSDTIVPWETAAALALTASAVFFSWLLVKPFDIAARDRAEALV